MNCGYCHKGKYRTLKTVPLNQPLIKTLLDHFCWKGHSYENGNNEGTLHESWDAKNVYESAVKEKHKLCSQILNWPYRLKHQSLKFPMAR